MKANRLARRKKHVVGDTLMESLRGPVTRRVNPVQAALRHITGNPNVEVTASSTDDIEKAVELLKSVLRRNTGHNHSDINDYSDEEFQKAGRILKEGYIQ